MRACIVAVGSELLTPLRMDTNSLRITERLNEVGIDVCVKVVVGDAVDELCQVMHHELEAADLLICTGGLGPTDDDVTREALARVIGLPLEMRPEVLERIRRRFAARKIAMPDINRRQAMAPQGAILLENRNGTAPGLLAEHAGKSIVLLPGPPREMLPMLEEVIRHHIAPRTGGAALFRRVLKITGRHESDVDATVGPIYRTWRSQPIPIVTTILAVLGQIELHLTAVSPDTGAAGIALDAAVRALERAIGPAVFSTDGRTLEMVVGDQLREARATIAVAESCTGGLLLSRLTDVPGSSDYVEAGMVCYSNRSKVEWLGVEERVIADHGAVSEPVAEAMARGIRARTGATVGVGVTGIAGPGGGTAAKPVGTVAIAVVSDGSSSVRTFIFIGGREQIKYQAAQAALDMVRLSQVRLQC